MIRPAGSFDILPLYLLKCLGPSVSVADKGELVAWGMAIHESDRLHLCLEFLVALVLLYLFLRRLPV